MRITLLIYFQMTVIASAQVHQLSIERTGPEEVQLNWNDVQKVVVEAAQSPDGPWISLKPPISYQAPVSLNTGKSPELHIDPQEAPTNTGIHFFRLKEASLFDIQPESGFVGKLDETDAFVAMIVASEECVAYVCNGDEEISEWFRGSISDPSTVQLSNGNNATFSANFSFTDSTYTGSVVLNGDQHAFSLKPNHVDKAGIYRVVDEQASAKSINAGWIVNELDEERGALRINSTFSRAPKIKDIKDGTSNTVLVAEVRVKAFRFAIKRRLNRRSFISLFSPKP